MLEILFSAVAMKYKKIAVRGKQANLSTHYEMGHMSSNGPERDGNHYSNSQCTILKFWTVPIESTKNMFSDYEILFQDYNLSCQKAKSSKNFFKMVHEKLTSCKTDVSASTSERWNQHERILCLITEVHESKNSS